MGALGLMGGTFNPIHHGHLFLAEEAAHAFALGRVLVIPNYQPPHRQDRVAPGEHRFRMVERATATNRLLEASRVELERHQISYTVDTVAHLKETEPEAELTFVTGADSLMRYKWRDLDRLLGLLERFVVGTRPGFPLSELEDKLDAMNLKNRDRIVPLHTPALEISSTDIRRRVAECRPIRYLVPDGVLEHIERHGLYRATADRQEPPGRMENR